MKRIGVGLLGMGLALTPLGFGVHADAGQEPADLARLDGQGLVQMLVQHETEASKHRGFYTYISTEKSERTGGHEWTERVAETQWGKLQYLIAEDGKPLSPERQAAERAKMQDDADHPDAFRQREQAKAQDEQHARQMMQLLPKAFLFDAPQQEGEYIRVHYHPNPSYQPNGLEERVLHGMVGSVLIDSKMVRTREIEGKLPQDISLGFGFLAVIHAGSNFSTTREHVEGSDWKTESVHTDFNAKALFLKTIARQEEAHRTDYKQIPAGISVAEAVKIVEQ